MKYKLQEFFGETLGTFILVLFGCGSVAGAVLFGSHVGLTQVALAWGVGVMLAIYATRHLSCAHLNPAVTIAMVAAGRMKATHMPLYIAAQLLGAVLAGCMIFVLFNPSIVAFEAANNIVRGTPESVATAKMFGEFFPNPGSGAVVTMPLAMLAEAFGTFLLLLFIFSFTEGCNVGRPDSNTAPIFIGLTVTSIICLVAPLTQAGLNPARDFGPRLVSWLAGWGDAAFPPSGGFFWVYILAPIVGGIIAAVLFTYVIEKLMKSKNTPCDCQK